MKSKISNIGKFILSSIIFFSSGILVSIFIKLFLPHFVVDSNHLRNYAIFDLVATAVGAIILVLINYRTLKENYINNENKIKGRNLKSYLKIVIKYTFMFFGIKILAGMLEATVGSFFNISITNPENQDMIEKIALEGPVYMIISATVFAPLSEELLFRGALKKVLNKKGIFITVSGLIFGLMHITESYLLLGVIFLIGLVLEMMDKTDYKFKRWLSVIAVASIIMLFLGTEWFIHGNALYAFVSIEPGEIINGIGYVAIGGYLAFLYTKHEDLLLNMSIHGLNNLISLVLYMLFL